MEVTGRDIPNTTEGLEMPWHNKLQRLEQQYTVRWIEKEVRAEIQRLIVNTQEMRRQVYAEQDRLRSVGMTYAERVKHFEKEKVQWCDEQESRLIKISQQLKVRPLSEWFDEVDYGAAKRNGMRWIIRLRFEQIIYG